MVLEGWGRAQALSFAGHDVIGSNSRERVPATTRLQSPVQC